MSVLEARILDYLNVALVRARIGSRQPRLDRADLLHYAAGLPADPFAGAAPLRLEPSKTVETAVETWRDARHAWTASRFAPGNAPTAALVFLHGWLATPLQLKLMRWTSARLVRAGIEVWIPRLPEHMERTTPGAVSGERCLSSDLVATGEALRRAVAETRAFRTWLRAAGRTRVGLWGISLGGWVGALSATVDPNWDAVALWTPVVDPVATLWESPLAEPMRAAIEQGGVDRTTAAAAFDRYAPLRRVLRVAPENVALIGARYDNVVSERTLIELGRAWQVPANWYPHGHISLIWSRRARHTCHDFLCDRLL